MSKAYNRDRWIAHVLCDYTCMNHIYTMPSKSLSFNTLKDFTAFVLCRYNCTVRIIRLDGEKSLGNAFRDWAAHQGITVE